MAFYLNTEIPENKKIFYALQHIYGIGPTLSKNICKKIGINPNTTIKYLSKKKINELFYFIENTFLINEELKKHYIQKKQFFLKIKHYKSYKK